MLGYVYNHSSSLLFLTYKQHQNVAGYLLRVPIQHTIRFLLYMIQRLQKPTNLRHAI